MVGRVRSLLARGRSGGVCRPVATDTLSLVSDGQKPAAQDQDRTVLRRVRIGRPAPLMPADTLLFAPDVSAADRAGLLDQPEAQIRYTAEPSGQQLRRALARPQHKPFWIPIVVAACGYGLDRAWPGIAPLSYAAYGVSAVTVAWFAAAEIRWGARRSATKKLAARLHRRHLNPSIDLDRTGRILVYRAQVASRTIAQCRLQLDGLLDGPASSAVLPALLWELATESADLAVRRAELARTLPGAGPAALAALEPVQAALAAANEALTRRVVALEQVAAEAARLDVRYQDMIAARAISAHDDAVLDLAAGRERDAVALTEIAMIADALPGAGGRIDRELAELAESAERLRNTITDIGS